VLALIPTLLITVTATSVLCAALATRTGGRIDERVMNRMLSTDASNPAGIAMIVLWLAPCLIVEIATVGASALILGHAAGHHRPIVPVAILALASSTAVALILLASARRSRRTDSPVD
jgi:hypothetical protein